MRAIAEPARPRRRTAGPGLLRLLTAAGLALLVPQVALAQLAHEVKGAFLFKFLSYVEWPDEALGGPHTPLVIGVLGDEDVREALEQIVQGRLAQGRPVEVRRLKAGDAPDGLHMLFAGRESVPELARFAGRRGLLLVGDRDDGLARGAMINLVLAENRVRFEVAPEAAERAGLHISSRMLALAQFVKPGPS
ncbi:MAG TPA: YfiR family protein [Candidatus Polarisedimenticolia bacterium]|nr:YfiR family protein [Candidatus Polarisedimenticolia bacterium]